MTGVADGEAMVEIRFLVPEAWRDDLVSSAKVQRISLADLMRIITRGFMRERYDEDKQRQLGLV